jgi:hypothetical protein
MRAFVLAGSLALVLALAPAASAHRRTLAPPGNSGVSQYVETVPTSGGGRPTNTVHPSGSPGSSSGQGTAVSPQTARALTRSGPAGAAAVALAQATAPPGVHGRGSGPNGSARARRGHGHHSSSAAAPAGGGGGSGGGGASPLGSVVKALTNSGSGGGGGLGPALPAILIACGLAAVGALLVRLRRRAG